MEPNVNNISVLINHKSQGHSRTSPASQPERNSVEEIHPCKVCKTIFSSKDALISHMKKHKFDCDYCSFKSDTKEQINKHINMTHIKRQKFYCDNCFFKADTKDQINDHMNASHKDPTPIKCSFGPDTFIDRKNIFAHRKQRHSTYKACRNGQNCAYIETCSFNHKPVTEGASICYHCGDEFTSTNDLLFHRKKTLMATLSAQNF